jgi:hypothetical protein
MCEGSLKDGTAVGRARVTGPPTNGEGSPKRRKASLRGHRSVIEGDKEEVRRMTEGCALAETRFKTAESESGESGLLG